MPHFISNFLHDRQFKVRVGSTLSDFFDQEMGVPQGSILSVTLFSIKINSLAKVLNDHTDGSLFVDDFGVSCRGKNMPSIERQFSSASTKYTNGHWKMALNFQRLKHHVCIFATCAKCTKIQSFS